MNNNIDYRRPGSDLGCIDLCTQTGVRRDRRTGRVEYRYNCNKICNRPLSNISPSQICQYGSCRVQNNGIGCALTCAPPPRFPPWLGSTNISQMNNASLSSGSQIVISQSQSLSNSSQMYSGSANTMVVSNSIPLNSNPIPSGSIPNGQQNLIRAPISTIFY